MPERAPQQRPPQEVAGRSMRRRRETQKRGPKGSGARSAPARHGARSHRRRLGSGRQTFARLALRECPGPRGGPPHTSERTVPAPVDGRGPAGAAGFGGWRAGVTDGAAEPWPPPPPTQLTCHPRPRYSGQRDSGRKSHSGSPLIGPVRAAAPSLRGGSAGLDWTPALSVRPRGRAFPPTAGAREGGAPWAERPPGAGVRPRGARVDGARPQSQGRGGWGAAAPCPGLRLGEGKAFDLCADMLLPGAQLSHLSQRTSFRFQFQLRVPVHI
ncbi:translation initiation factor IF-2-like [Ursus americanus]|uniref:translation initiation factor IF-2-like n=1 Tax=Ursus americanus TaxID=9643 RepID=UPI001E67A3D2|nr:translation initiation factor IF-2-like [Ursus americanus]